MALDPALRNELLDARARISAQLDELYFRATASGFARRGGPPDYRQVYAELQKELDEIDQILSDAGPSRE
jgi:hypothetical protein